MVAAVPAAALRPLCVVLKAAAAWQQTDAIAAHLVQKDIGGRESLMPSSLKALNRPAHHQVPSQGYRRLITPCGSCRCWPFTQQHDAWQCSAAVPSLGASSRRRRPTKHVIRPYPDLLLTVAVAVITGCCGACHR